MQELVENYLHDTSYVLQQYVNKKEIYIQDKYGTYKTTLSRLQNKQYPTSQTVLNFSQWLVNKANEVHLQQYAYRIPDSCLRLKDTFYVICLKHGEYKTNYTNHIFKRNGCKKCSVENKCKSHDSFLQTARKIHKNTYDYSITIYTCMKSKVDIICKTHGVFKQTPDKHLKGQGCPKCSSEKSKICGYSRSDFIKSSERSVRKPYLYVIRCFDDTEEFYKIGITATSLKLRFSGKKLPYNYEVTQIIESEDAGLIYDIEKALHKYFNNLKYIPIKKFDGLTECFKYV